MATRTFGPDLNAVNHGLNDRFATVRSYVGAGLQAMGPTGRRLALTAFGAVLALCLGAATASAFRLPSEVTDPAQPQDQVLAQSELPSEAAARAYALENPPVYTTAADHADAAPTDTTVETATLTEDIKPMSAVTYTGPADDPSPTKTADGDAAPSASAVIADANDASRS